MAPEILWRLQRHRERVRRLRPYLRWYERAYLERALAAMTRTRDPKLHAELGHLVQHLLSVAAAREKRTRLLVERR